MITNQNVIIVGPSSHVRNMKDFIHSFDIIARPNLSYPVPKKMRKHIGERTDVCFTLMGIARRYIRKDTHITQPVKAIFIDPIDSEINFKENKRNTKEWCEKTGMDLVQWDWNLVKKEMPYLDIYNQIGKYPSTGIYLINFILNMNPKSVYLTGYSFGIMPHHIKYPSNTYRTEPDLSLLISPNRWHCFLLDLFVVKKFYTDGRIEIDDFLKNLFNVNIDKIVNKSILKGLF